MINSLNVWVWSSLEALLSLLGLGEGVGGQRSYSSISGVQ